jgi:L-alanine-DL-glutamate epimerase-like enolase superfamily enzyme
VLAHNNSRWLEFIPQLDLVTKTGIQIENGRAIPSMEPGLGIDWDWPALDRQVVLSAIVHGKLQRLREGPQALDVTLNA